MDPKSTDPLDVEFDERHPVIARRPNRFIVSDVESPEADELESFGPPANLKLLPAGADYEVDADYYYELSEVPRRRAEFKLIPAGADYEVDADYYYEPSEVPRRRAEFKLLRVDEE